ncbi:MAG: roadblock/LC7 domain-containing protein [Acidimicrobiia bacterium]|nr:roadblock/LC7 domain-containing protein [Acidimicrobiia bacterium]
MSTQTNDVSWLISSFVEQTPGVVESIVVSSDGLLMAMSKGLDRAGGDRFAAVASGLIGLAYGAAGRFGGGKVNEVIVEMDNALLLVTGISDGSALGVVADANCDIGYVGYEMAVLVEKTGRVLTPELRAQLVSSLPR